MRIMDNIPPLDIVIKVGDTHFGFGNNSMEWFHRSREFVENLLIPIIKKSIEKYGKDRVSVLFMGDQGDNKQSINTYIQNKMIDMIKEIQSLVIVHMLVGNHDTPLINDVSVNSNKSFGLMPNVYVHSEPTIINTVNGGSMGMTPWISTKESMLNILAEYKEKGVKYMAGHNEVFGFHYEGKPVEESNNITISDLSFLTKAWFGHIHKRQSKNNVSFVGSSYHIKKGEYKNSVGVTVYSFKKDKEHFIENTLSPKFKRISLFKIMNMTVREANEFVKNSYTTVILPSNLYGYVNTTKINDVLTGYRDIDSVSISGKESDPEQPQLDTHDIDETLYDKQIDVRSSIAACINDMTSVVMNKQSVMLSDKLKKKMVDTLNDVYKMASEKTKEQIEF